MFLIGALVASLSECCAGCDGSFVLLSIILAVCAVLVIVALGFEF